MTSNLFQQPRTTTSNAPESLTTFNTLGEKGFGETWFNLKAFIVQSGIEPHVSILEDGVRFIPPENLRLEDLIDENLTYFERNPTDPEIIDHYLRVLNEASRRLGPSFNRVVDTHMEFLSQSDLIYGIAYGNYLDQVAVDDSLQGLPDVQACLRIYKRLLLPVIQRIKDVDSVRKRLSQYPALRSMIITEYGELAVDDFENSFFTHSTEQSVELLIENFNNLLSWLYERLVTVASVEIDELLSDLKTILSINRERAIELNIYQTLLAQLSRILPQFRDLYSEHLVELVDERTKQLTEAKERLLKAERLATIGETATMVGHDLRNPLQVIVNTQFLLLRKFNTMPPEYIQYVDEQGILRLLEVITAQIKYMNKIVLDLQDYAGPMTPVMVETNLKQLLYDVLSANNVPETVKTSLLVDDALTLIVDPQMMRRVFINLITNALQAMPKGGRISITGTEENGCFSISVADTGIGIPEENNAKLFQPLFTTKAKGQGLGLSLSKRIIDAHHGTIMVESEVGKGTKFTIQLPRELLNPA